MREGSRRDEQVIDVCTVAGAFDVVKRKKGEIEKKREEDSGMLVGCD